MEGEESVRSSHGPEIRKTASLRSQKGTLTRQDSARSRGSNRSGTAVSTGGSSNGSMSLGTGHAVQYSLWREACRSLVQNRLFTGFIYISIAFNTTTIAMNDLYVERDNSNALRRVVEVSDWAVLCVFTVEMFLKMYAWGFFYHGKRSEEAAFLSKNAGKDEDDDPLAGYFSSSWNIFDFIIVVVSWATAPLAYVSGIDASIGRLVRAVRTARPLRALRTFDGTQDVLKTFPHAIPSMRDGMMLLAFVFVVYAILGVNLFGVDGTFHGRCVVDDSSNRFGTRGLLQKERGLEVLCGSGWKCDDGFRCSCKPDVLSNGTVEQMPWSFLDPMTGDPGCLELGAPRPWSSDVAPVPSCPDYGMTCFNNVAVALLTCFKTITMDNWTVTMWWAQDAFNPIIGWLYFVSLVVLVSFNIVNLYVASISASYRQVREQRKEINRVKKTARLGKSRLNGRRELDRNEDDDDNIADLDDEEPLLSRLLNRIRPARKKLSPFSHAFRRLVMYPQVIDECGFAVQSDLIVLALERNLVIKFGPELGQWKLIYSSVAGGGAGATGDESGDRRDLCTGNSLDPGREDLRAAILGIELVEKSDAEAENNADDGLENDTAPWFDIAVLVCIMANTITMAIEHFDGTAVAVLPGFSPSDHCCDPDCTIRDQSRCPRGLLKSSEAMQAVLETAEAIFSVIFSFEMVLKIIALEGVLPYVLENFPFNLFDLIVVLVSDAMLIAGLFVKTNINIAVFRLLRIMRAFRLVTAFRRLRMLFTKAYSAFVSILYVLFVLVFWHVIGALLAMQLFSCPVRNEDECELVNGQCPPGCSDLIGDPAICVYNTEQIYEHCPWDKNINFNTFLDGIIVLLYVTTGEAWSEIMGQGMRSYASIWPGLLFFIIFHIIAFYLLYNLFIGVIVQEFELTDEQKEGMQLGFFRVKVLRELKRMRIKRRNVREDGFGDVAATRRPLYTNKDVTVADEDEDDAAVGFFLDEPEEEVDLTSDGPILFGMLKPPMPNAQFPDASKNFRSYVRDLLLNQWFDRTILLTIFASAVILALESPVKEYSSLDPEVVRMADMVFFAVFVLEFVLKLFDRGVYWESNRTYFKLSWNILDFLILLFQVLDLSGLAGADYVRLFRMLRPLRLLNKIKSLQILLLAMQACAVDVLNVLLLWFFAFVIFAIFGVSLFSGKLSACNDASFVGSPLNPSELLDSPVGWRENCVGTYFSAYNENDDAYVSESLVTPIMKPRVWSNPVDSASELGFSFDTFLTALQTLFEVSTFEQWASVVSALQSTSGVGQQPINKISAMNVLYLVAWLILSCFFVLQLVIGVLVDAINQKTGKSLMTALQRNWMQMEQKLQKLKPLAQPKLPKSNSQSRAWRLVNQPLFQKFITLVIMANICVLASESYDMPPQMHYFVKAADYAFISVYLTEIVLKLYAYGLSFFQDAWNSFDFIVVVSSLVELSLGNQSGLTTVRALRMVKVLRTVRLVRRAKRLRLIISALIRSLPHIMSSVVLLSLFIFLFAVLGVQLFGGVRQGYGIHRRNNFNNAWNGCLLLLRVLTGEDWQTVLHDCAIEYPMCTTNEEARLALGNPDAIGDCGDINLAYLFFDAFYNIGNNILLNLFIAVLLENFFTLQSNFVLSEAHLESYQKTWRTIDKNGEGQISVWRLRELVEKLHQDNNPLGSCVLASEIKMRCVRIELLETCRDDSLTFQDVAVTLALHVVGAHGLPYGEMLKRHEKLAYYAHLASISKMTVKFRSAKMMRARNPMSMRVASPSDCEDDASQFVETPNLRQRRRVTNSIRLEDAAVDDQDHQNDEDSILLQQLMSDAIRESTDARRGHRNRPHAAASLAEICLASLPGPDLERAISDLDAMLSSVSDDRYINSARSALHQLMLARDQTPSVWPIERPKHR